VGLLRLCSIHVQLVAPDCLEFAMAELAEHPQIPPVAEPPAVQPPKFVAVIDDYDGLLATIRATIGRVDTTLETLEEAAGLPNRYLSKVAGPRRTRYFGPSLFYVLSCLGLKLAVVQDPELVERYRDHLTPRRQSRAGQARGRTNGHP
jgi:hypothetical protein